MNEHDNTYPLAEPATTSYNVPSAQLPQVINITCPPPRGGSVLGRFLLLFLVFGFLVFCSIILVAGMVGAVTELAKKNAEENLVEKRMLGNAEAEDKILVLSVEGIIMGGHDSFVARQIRQAKADPAIKAVVLHVNSPGGSAEGSDYFYHLLKQWKDESQVPFVVSMASLAASGGYYVSMVGDKIYAERLTWTGSIGVIIPKYNGERFVNMIGIESTPIVSGEHKGMGGFTKRLTDDERAIYQELVDDCFRRFKEVVREGRPDFDRNPEKLDALATGRVFTGPQAVENGLVDEIGFLDDAVSDAMNRAGLSEDTCQVVRYKKPMSFADAMLGVEVSSASADGPGGPAALSRSLESALVDLTTPRAYFLCPGVLPLKAAEE